MDTTRTQQLMEVAREQGMIRMQDLRKRGIPHSYVQRLYQRGILRRSGRGVYVLADFEPGQNFSLAEACLRVPHGTICLLSALRFHNIGTQSPFEVWVAVHPKARRPRVDYPPLHVVRFSKLALTEGVEEHTTAEGTIRVYGTAKTVVDCFRYRNKIGLDIALEALRDCFRTRRVTIDELWNYARLLRISTVIRPYLESLL